MLSLYLYTLIIGHKSCNMLNILNKLTLQKKLQNPMTNNVFFGQTLAGAGNSTPALLHLKRVRTTAPPS